jgi:multisubunit Na+/H+ antiporter MnhG subunit
VHWIRVPSHQSSLAAIGLWRLVSSLQRAFERILSFVLVIIVATIIPFWILLGFSSRSADILLHDLSTI